MLNPMPENGHERDDERLRRERIERAERMRRELEEGLRRYGWAGVALGWLASYMALALGLVLAVRGEVFLALVCLLLAAISMPLWVLRIVVRSALEERRARDRRRNGG
jgi:hypothetical protein